MDKDNLEILDNCINCGVNASNNDSSMLPIDTSYRPMPLMPSLDFDLKYIYIKNIAYKKETFYSNDLQYRNKLNNTNQKNASNIILEYDNIGDTYSDEDLYYMDKVFIDKNNLGTNVINLNYKKLQDSSLELIPNFYRILPEKRIILDNELCSNIDCDFSYFVDTDFGNPEIVYPIGTFFRVANGVSVSSPCDQQIYFVTNGNCICPIPNKQTLQVMLIERGKVIQSVFVIEQSEFTYFEVLESCLDRTSEWIPRFEIDSGCKTPDLEIDLSALDRIQIPKLPDVIQGAAGAAGAAGSAGPAGAAGSSGKDGKDGKDGNDGNDGNDGVCPNCPTPAPTPTPTILTISPTSTIQITPTTTRIPRLTPTPTPTFVITARPTLTPDVVNCECYDGYIVNASGFFYEDCLGNVVTNTLGNVGGNDPICFNVKKPYSSNIVAFQISNNCSCSSTGTSITPTPITPTPTLPVNLIKYYELSGCSNTEYAYTTIDPTMGVGQRYINPLTGIIYTYTGAPPLLQQPTSYNGSIQIVSGKQYCSNSDIANPTTPPPQPTPTTITESKLSYNLFLCGTNIASNERIVYTGTYNGGEVIKTSNGKCYTVSSGTSSQPPTLRVIASYSTCMECNPMVTTSRPPITPRPTPTPTPTPIPTSPVGIVNCECYDGYITDDSGFFYEDCYGNKITNSIGREVNNSICFNIQKPYSSNITSVQLSENCSCGGLYNPNTPQNPEIVPTIGVGIGTTSGDNGNTSDVLPPNELRIDNFR
jgi:hypothetical protein